MHQGPDKKRDFFEFLTRTASLHYLEGKTQAEVARALGISRQKVQRLLRQARDLGIVEINIKNPNLVSLDLERRLKAAFSLKEVILAASHPYEEERRHSVARAAASYLERHVLDGMVVTVGMGRNTGEIPDFFFPPRNLDCTFVSAMGNSPHVGESINPNNICRRLAANARARAIYLHAPATVESLQAKEILLAQEAVGPILDLARKADLALIGIGTPSDDATLVRMDCISREEAKGLAQSGVVGDLLGTTFDKDGQVMVSPMRNHIMGLTLEDLRGIPTVIAVVSEKGKSGAILGALRTGVLHVLITETENALEIAEMLDA